MATIQLYADKINRMQGLIKETKQTVTVYRAELLTLKTKMLTIDKSVCDLGDITASIQASSQIQEEKITSLNTFHKDCEDFISEVVRIDHDVADRIHTRKEEFYAQYYYLKPEYEKTWLEVIKDWFTAVREWCRQKWELQTEERAVRCVRMYKEAVVFLSVGVLGQKQVKEGEMPRYLKDFLKQLRTNPDRIIMNAEQIKKYEELKRWPGWWGKEGGSECDYEFKYNWTKEGLPSSEFVTPEFLEKVVEIADKLEISPDDLMAVMAFESWINPNAQNPVGAYGLIQFTNIAIVEINRVNGTKYTKEDIKDMTALEQLDIVYLHYKSKAGKMHDLGDIYLVTLAPAFVDGTYKNDDTILYSKESDPKYYEANKGLDKEKKGYITKGDAYNAVLVRRGAFSYD